MQNFLADFSYFMEIILNGVISIWNWFSSTFIGEIVLFTIGISLFFIILNLIVDAKD